MDFEVVIADPETGEIEKVLAVHDVGKAIDPTDHVSAGLEALTGFITDRTGWLIAHHMHAHAIHAGTIGARARRRLNNSENFDYDYLIIGSGFGGSVSALRLAEKGYRVGVLETGRRYGDKDYAKSAWNVRKFLWAPFVGCRGILRMTPTSSSSPTASTPMP